MGLVYFEGTFARAEAESDDEQTEDLEDDDALEVFDGALNVVPVAIPASVPPSGAAVGGGGSPTAPEVVDAGAGAPAAAAPEDGRLAMATAASAEAAAALPVAPPAPALVVVPDIEGMSLRKAKKQLAAVGLRLSVRDEYGDKIPRQYWSEYEVRKQKRHAGTEVEAGSMVKVKARMRMRYAKGY